MAMLAWNLRNLPVHRVVPKDVLCVLDTCTGTYPIEAWRTYYLEVPSKGSRKNIVGRTNHTLGICYTSSPWDLHRSIRLPVYIGAQVTDLVDLTAVIRNWRYIGISDDVPCLSLACKCRGIFSEGIEAQSVVVLAVWHDGVARTISLDWSEGGWEDCPTPEWYMQASPLMTLQQALSDIEGAFRNIWWSSRNFTLYSVPECLCHGLLGEKGTTQFPPWGHGTGYEDQTLFFEDLYRLTSRIRALFEDHAGQDRPCVSGVSQVDDDISTVTLGRLTEVRTDDRT